MRILASFLFGLALSFLLGDLSYRLGKQFPKLEKIFPINYSIFGIIFILVGTYLGITAGLNALKSISGFFLIGSGIGLIFHHLLAKQYILFRDYERNFVHKHEAGVDRFLEILPGALVWIAITSPIWLSFTLPFAVAYIILIADVYWLISAIKIAVLIYLGYKKYEWAKAQDWHKKLEQDFPDQWQGYYHLIVLPCYNESLEVVGPAIDAVINSDYPKDKIFLAVGREAWAKPELLQETENYMKKADSKIAGALYTVHQLQEGELKGPATNRNNIVRSAVKELQKRHIPLDKVLVTTLDSDFAIHKQFLAGALHKYLETPAEVRDKRTYTGVFFYYNNYWQAPTPMRLIAVGTSFWQLAEMVGSDKYRNFASMSINLKSLLAIGLWIPNKVNDDSGFYWKAYYHFDGDYKVIPHYLPINGDTVLDENLLKTFKNQYLQQKRWAYGVEHIPFVVKQYFANQKLDFWDKTDNLVFALWGYVRWGVLALFVTFAGLIIPLINPTYSQSVVAYNLPVISSWILTFAFLGIFCTIFVHEKTAPPRPKHWSRLRKFWSYVQWVLVPMIIVTISTLPAIDAMTSLMLGRYIEFRVTNKARTSV